MLADGGKLMTNFQNDKENFLANIMGVKNLPQGHEIAQRTIDQYLDRNKPFDQQLSAIDRVIDFYQSLQQIFNIYLVQMTSDSLIFKCTEDTIHLHTKYSSKPTYYYYYTHRGLYSMTPLLGASPTLDLGSFIFLRYLFELWTETDLQESATEMNFCSCSAMQFSLPTKRRTIRAYRRYSSTCGLRLLLKGT